jgi:hypothetical protein
LTPSPTCGWRSCQAVGYALEAEDLPCRQRATTALEAPCCRLTATRLTGWPSTL